MRFLCLSQSPRLYGEGRKRFREEGEMAPKKREEGERTQKNRETGEPA